MPPAERNRFTTHNVLFGVAVRLRSKRFLWHSRAYKFADNARGVECHILPSKVRLVEVGISLAPEVGQLNI
jgi:hypothetical protein